MYTTAAALTGMKYLNNLFYFIFPGSNWILGVLMNVYAPSFIHTYTNIF